MSIRSRAGKVVRYWSPRHRNWRRLLASLKVDPDRLPRPVPAPGPRDFVICGVPRSGTSLATAALFQPPKVVTVMEPWDGMKFPPAELFASLRNEIASGTLQRGRLDLGALAEDGQVKWCRDGELPHAVDVEADYLLGVKWPAFWRYLDLLPTTKFVVCVRNPAHVIGSFRDTKGQLTQGLEYDLAFNRTMNNDLLAATRDPLVRQVLLMDHVIRHVVPHLERPNVFTLRYERWFDDRDALLAEVSSFLDVDVRTSPVVIRPLPRVDVDADVADLIARHSTAAELLGYDPP